MRAVDSMGLHLPTPIQAQAIPAVLQGRDVWACAPTGSGKTLAYALPLVQLVVQTPKQTNFRRPIRCLVLVPTRELALQVGQVLRQVADSLGLKAVVAHGGVSINPQMMALRGGADVVVATTGRLLDLVAHNALRLSDVQHLVLDEADRMLDMGFIRDITRIIALLPKRRQNLMFSATFSDDIRKLANGLVRNPIEISVSPRNAAAPTVSQWIYTVDKKQKAPLLTRLIKDGDWSQALVFTKTKHGANKLTKHLEGQGIVAAAIHGNKSQGARTRALADFKAGSLRVLVATDLAARGIDIHQLPHVVNLDLPNQAEDYVHRIGRTGRAVDLVERMEDLVAAAGRGDDLNVNFLDHFELYGRRKLTLQVTAQGFGSARSGFDRIERKKCFFRAV